MDPGSWIRGRDQQQEGLNRVFEEEAKQLADQLAAHISAAQALVASE
jgi:uncharacterized lipoprotein YmbA